MKTKIILAIFLILFIAGRSISQVIFSTRGHNQSDIYINYYDAYNTSKHLIYFIENGNKLLYNNPGWDEGYPVPESVEGKIISISTIGPFLLGSDDYGKTKNIINVYPNEYIAFEQIFGGEIPGEFIFEGRDISIYPYPNQTQYYSLDYGYSYVLIADSSEHEFHNGEIGSSSGEMYQLPVIAGHGFVCRSNDYSLTFDTTAIDTNILNENLGLNFAAISHGSTAGDLFLVIKDNNVIDAVMYHIYHSSDYGHSWQLKSDPLIDDPDVKFTAGRAPCSFYIAHSHLNAGDDYSTLYIEYSNDCGATFTTYSYLMTPDVANEKPDKAETFATITPNPATDKVTIQFANKAKQVKIKLLSTEGKEVSVYDNINGNKNFNIILNGLSAGVYLVQFIQDGTLKQVSKLIIQK